MQLLIEVLFLIFFNFMKDVDIKIFLKKHEMFPI